MNIVTVIRATGFAPALGDFVFCAFSSDGTSNSSLESDDVPVGAFGDAGGVAKAMCWG